MSGLPAGGAKRRRVTFQRRVAQPVGGGARGGATWTDVLTCWAQLEPGQRKHGGAGAAGMLLAADLGEAAAYAQVPYTVTIDWRPPSELSITSDLRIVEGGRVFHIDVVIDPDERHERLVILCRLQGNSGNF